MNRELKIWRRAGVRRIAWSRKNWDESRPRTMLTSSLGFYDARNTGAKPGIWNMASFRKARDALVVAYNSSSRWWRVCGIVRLLSFRESRIAILRVPTFCSWRRRRGRVLCCFFLIKKKRNTSSSSGIGFTRNSLWRYQFVNRNKEQFVKVSRYWALFFVDLPTPVGLVISFHSLADPYLSWVWSPTLLSISSTKIMAKKLQSGTIHF